MAQPLIKFFRVAKIADLQATQKVQGGLYFETSTGVLYVYNGTAFEAYSGLKSASFANQKLVLTPSVGAAIEIDLSGYVDSGEFNTELAKYVKKEQTIAGIDLKDSITAEELKTALGLTADNLAGEANVLESVKVNGETLNITDKAVNIIVAEGSADGTIAVNGKNVAVHGLGSAAYTDATAYDEAGAAAAALAAAKEYANSLPHENTTYTFAEGSVNGEFVVTPSNGTAQQVKVHGLGTAAYHAEGDFVSSTGYVAYSEAEKTKLEGIEANAEVNIIETVKVNGVALTPNADRAVDVIIPDAAVKGVKAGDKVLALGQDGLLSTTISLDYTAKSAQGDGIIYLKGIDGANLGQIDTTEFIKDGMIDSVAWSTEENKKNYLVITWNTDAGKQKTEIDFGKYIDTWTHRDAANGIAVVDDKYVGVVDPASETFLTVGKDGFKLAGVQEAIKAAVAAKNVSANGDTYVSATVADGTNHVTVAASETTKASLALADSALQAADITTGVTNGTIAVEGVDVAVKGLGDAAYVGTTATPTENSTAAFTAGGAYVLDGKIAANTTAIAGVQSEVSENAQVTAAALTDLNDRLATAEGKLTSGVGVMSVTKGTDGKFVTTNIDNTDATNPKVGVSVAYTESTATAKALATDAYVQEQVGAVASTAITSVTSETLQVTPGTNTVDVELVWASF